MESDQLAPCPFCGGDAEIVSWNNWPGTFHARCKALCCCEQSKIYQSEEESKNEWNKRRKQMTTENDADAAFIAKAVNAHDKLRNALKEAVRLFAGRVERACYSDERLWLAQARYALGEEADDGQE